MAMTMKHFRYFFVAGLFILGACSAEKQPAKNEVSTSGEEAGGGGGSVNQKLAAGKTLYETNCASCHDAGTAGAPKLGDKAAWSDRMAQGMDTMVKKSIEGFDGKVGMMPPKGGNSSLTDEEVTSAVKYIISK
jgi:cytochrome c5